MKKKLIYTIVCYWLLSAGSVIADSNDELLGDVSDGSRSASVHLVNLLDEEGQKILSDDEPSLAFSMRQTCGDCHSYDIINTGWHFNSTDPNVAPGRSGEPWILVDAATATQIPLSYRPWPGTFRPEQLGLGPWEFIRFFGRHTPGGGAGELLDKTDNPEETIRTFISGKLEINCLSCHNADPSHNQAEYAAQLSRQNFRWAGPATCGFASVSGSAKQMPNTYDPIMPDVLDDPKLIPPAIVYRKDTLDHKNRVFFNITRDIPDQRCYFCHSTAESDKTQHWSRDEDVHISAGLNCVDCHRNGVDHNIIRGYDGEEMASKNPLAATSSCIGCHTEGRLGAPKLVHSGIPAVHFAKLTCTACHSGPWPEQKTSRVKTSRAHGLGTHGVNRSADALPHIISPVFAKQTNAKIAPHNLIWPAYWATLANRKVTPINLEIVKQTAGKIIAPGELPHSGDWPSLTEKQIAEVLALLSSQNSIEGEPVYICGGKLYHLDDKANLISAEHDTAGPYLWPFAHNVRPAAQSLGAHGCTDCHSKNASFFFGEVDIDNPLTAQRGSVKKMLEFQDADVGHIRSLALWLRIRPWLVVIILGCCAVIAAVIILYAFKALDYILKVLSGRDT